MYIYIYMYQVTVIGCVDIYIVYILGSACIYKFINMYINIYIYVCINK